jgi:hypothetical protein
MSATLRESSGDREFCAAVLGTGRVLCWACAGCAGDRQFVLARQQADGIDAVFVFGDTSDLLDDDAMDWTVGNPVLLPIPGHECDFVVS